MGEAVIGFRHYHEGDICPECGKRKLIAVVGRSLLTLGRLKPWLVCDGHPRCGFATRRIAKAHLAANDNRLARRRFR